MSAILDIPILAPRNVPPNGRSLRVTQRALEKMRDAIKREVGLPAQGGLRVSVEGGGCAGLNYNISFDHHRHGRDRVHEFEDVRVLMDPKSFIYLYGMILDYDENAAKPGFNIVDPNSRQSCGCGSTFSA